MTFEETNNNLQIRLWKITDQFGDRIHLTKKELITLYGEIAKTIYLYDIIKDYKNDKKTS